ncbi:hypothetical protein C8J57DRAFT_1252973 [Mycena rebaudengoi]|nr:hypothetical protein C8J57DRAFT_1252973 [Mycena rebaudengoi]
MHKIIAPSEFRSLGPSNVRPSLRRRRSGTAPGSRSPGLVPHFETISRACNILRRSAIGSIEAGLSTCGSIVGKHLDTFQDLNEFFLTDSFTVNLHRDIKIAPNFVQTERFSKVLNLEPERRVRFSSAQVRTDFRAEPSQHITGERALSCLFGRVDVEVEPERGHMSCGSRNRAESQLCKQSRQKC